MVVTNPDNALAAFFAAFRVKTADDDPSVIVQRDLELIRQEYAEVDEALRLLGDDVSSGGFRPLTEGRERLVADALKELADLVYVAVHAARSMGFDLMPIFAEVDRSNMSKVCRNCGRPHRDEIGKVLKTVDGYEPADIVPLVRAQNSAFHAEPLDAPSQAA